jgi:serine/threonine protein phosphatase PrpC
MTVSFTAFCQRGTGKANNEDAVLLNGQVHQGRVREHGEVDTALPCYFAVADGVSISTQPRVASRRLLELLHTRLETAHATASLTALLHQVQQEFVALSANPDLLGMATTLVGLRIVDSTVTIFNVGDSRAYLLTSGASVPQARLLSRDHSMINDMIDDGEITPEQSENAASFMRGLTSHFIADPECDEFKVNVVSHQWLPGERLLLCSDGLNEVLSDAEIAAILVSDSVEDQMNACKASRRAGGTDDFSVIVLSREN